uniref:protein kinase domain-containing protein n=1 Tax=Paractinoplanes polyasparticus TaxID=2856853 RepID=UPI003F68D656
MSSSPPLVVADRYRLVAPLGQGGMGRVWRATDVVLHREVAIKELVPPPGLTAAERQEMRERSLREARAIARLNNINVVRVFDVLRTDADPWIVMEYVPSRSLQDTLAADGPYSPVRAAEIGLGVLNALRAAHRAGVVHRDVKPGNVLIGADGRVVLTDFGLATVPGDPNVTRTGLVLGSPAYIAPERARDGSAGPAADLWSLGATLYAAVEGASPFARPSAIATLAALATENPPPARNAGPMKPVLNGLLRKDPTHRINAEEAERLLLRAAGRRSKLSFPMSPTMRRPGVGRDRAALTGGTASTPVVPGPRPPVARPANPPGRTPVTPAQGRAASPPQPPVNPGRPGADQGRPVFAPGKAPVSRPAAETPTRVDTPKVDAPRLDATRVDGPKIDATRVDGPPVRDDKTTFIGTGPHAPEPPRSGPHASGGISRTSRGAQSGFTAADVAANRRKTAAPEHERSLADATALIPRVEPDAPAEQKPVPAQADPTTKIQTPPKNTTAPAKPKRNTPEPADKTTRIPAPVDQTTKITGPSARPVDPTTKISEPVDRTTKITEPAKKPEPAKSKAEDATLAGAKPTGTQPADAKGDVKDSKPPAKGKTDKAVVVDATQVVSPAKSAPAKGKKTAVPAKRVAPAAAGPNSEGDTPAADQNSASEAAATGAAQVTTDDSAAQGGSAQGSTEQGNSEQSGTAQGSSEQGSSAQGGTAQGSPDQAGPEQGGTAQGGTAQGGTAQGGTAQGSPDQAGTEQGGTAQGNTEQGNTEQDGAAQAGDAESSATRARDAEKTAPASDAESSATRARDAEKTAPASDAESSAAQASDAESSAAQASDAESSA